MSNSISSWFRARYAHIYIYIHLVFLSDFVDEDRQQAWERYLQAHLNVPVVSYSREKALESNANVLKCIGVLSRETSYKKGRDEDLNHGTLMVGLVRTIVTDNTTMSI